MTFYSEQDFDLAKFKRQVKIDLLGMIGLFLYTVFIVYFLPAIVRDALFLIPLGLFWRSKKDYFWLAYVFMLENRPAYFWHSGSLSAKFRLPLYGAPGIGSLSIVDLFIIIALLKFLYNRREHLRLYIVEPIIPFLGALLILCVFTGMFFGTTVSTFFHAFRSYFYFSLIFTLPGLLRHKYDLIRFGYLTVPFVVLILADQLHTVMAAKPLLSLISPEAVKRMYSNVISGEIRPIMGGPLILFYIYIFSFILRRNKRLEIFPQFANIVFILCLMSFFVSVTRAWMTISIVLIFVYMFFNKAFIKTTVWMPIGVASFIGILIMLNLTDYFYDNIIVRYLGFVQTLVGGDVASYDTVGYRVEHGIPKLMEGIKLSPFIGLGFSKLQYSYYNSDFGFLNTILTTGVIGLAALIITYTIIVSRVFRMARTCVSNLSNSIYEAVLCGFAGIFIAFAITWDFFAFTVPYKVIFISLLLAHIEIAYKINKDAEIDIINNKELKT